ncbi:MAG: ketoacyl-ACP synthase III [Deltaproteobacteria bacterium]|nr:ketoacyl-ACP synthase III [Deltaproteobacteria bacterium]
MLYLHGIGHFHPENVITNRFLVELGIGTDETWILERVGIRERRTVLSLDYICRTKNRDPRAAHEASLYRNAETAAAAARMALDRAGLGPGDIGLVISGCCAPTLSTPAEAATVAAELGIDAPCLDVNSACTSFGMQIDLLSRMAAERLPPYVLIVQPENITRAIDFSDRSTAVLFGDGSAAAIVSASVKARTAFVEFGCGTNASAWKKVNIPPMGHFHQDGHAVQGFAIRRMTESARCLMDVPGNGNGHGERFHFIGHQANLGALRTVCERAAIPERQHWYNVDGFGNTGCAGAPSVLSEHWEDLRPGDRVSICLVGAGLTWVHLLLAVDDNRRAS